MVQGSVARLELIFLHQCTNSKNSRITSCHSVTNNEKTIRAAIMDNDIIRTIVLAFTRDLMCKIH